MENCKYCDSQPTLEKFIVGGHRVRYYVRCRMCGQQVGLYQSDPMNIETAIKEWNKRQEQR